MSASLPDYDVLNDALRGLNPDLDAAELHGQLCGMLCVQPRLPEADAWRRILGRDPDDRARERLHEVWRATRAMFEGGQFDFRPLLPTDEARLESRVEALAHWAQGFLLGLDRLGLTDRSKLPGELPGIAGDLGKIAAAESYALDDEESDENAFMELVEYLRVAVQLFREELQESREAKGGNEAPPTVH